MARGGYSEEPVTFGWTSLCRMVRSRWWADDQLSALPNPPPVARLEKLCVDSPDSSRLTWALEEFIAKGFRFTKSYYLQGY
ncbi:hypothetical protein B0H19DRAFT_1191019, partial [Mycena capillaripes]